MSPLALRRFRAERLLRRDFEGLRATVLSAVRRRLAQSGARLDTADLEECYAQAWHGLYATMLAGQEVLSPTGWLIQVTFRRAVEEARASGREQRWEAAPAAREPDPAQRLDDHARLRQVFEALRMRLRGRECEAASLCYLQGLTRAEAAARMGISEARMTKLMDGGGPGQPGVAAKVGVLLGTIRAGRWCDEQASLMRGLAFGVLEPGGERHRMALAHQRECPSCRAYVASLRGLAAALPPLALPVGIGAAGAAAGAGGAAAGGGWLLAGGSLSAKLAVGCAIALSVGAGCVALTVVRPQRPSPRPHAHRRAGHAQPASATTLLRLAAPAPAAASEAPVPGAGPSATQVSPPAGAVRRAARAGPASEPRARREFGLEGGPAPVASAVASSTPAPGPAAVQASAPRPAPAPAAAASRHTRHEFGFE